jgi:hypothetical protein
MDLLERYQWLPFSKQQAVAAKCNTSRLQVLIAIRDVLVALTSF